MAISDIPPFLASFLYPVIALSTNINEPSHIYFVEEALELWMVVIQNSTALTPELLQLSSNLFPIIGKRHSASIYPKLFQFNNYVCVDRFKIHRKYIGEYSNGIQHNSSIYSTRFGSVFATTRKENCRNLHVFAYRFAIRRNSNGYAFIGIDIEINWKPWH